MDHGGNADVPIARDDIFPVNGSDLSIELIGSFAGKLLEEHEHMVRRGKDKIQFDAVSQGTLNRYAGRESSDRPVPMKFDLIS
jgi:hypothetical protein